MNIPAEDNGGYNWHNGDIAFGDPLARIGKVQRSRQRERENKTERE